MIREAGVYQSLGGTRYFVPHPLPPQKPPLSLNIEIVTLFGEAMHELGQLNEMSERLPDTERFINNYVYKEAMLSSEIEGIHTTLIETLGGVDNEEKVSKETKLVRNYKKSLDAALKVIQNDKLPISSRVILAAHKALMIEGASSPGEYRKQTVKLSGTDFIPPLPSEVLHLMSDLEKYINDGQDPFPSLIKAGLVHLQFETIHPFLDGNGRIGRMLIVLMLLDRQLLKEPIIYPSYYFKKYRREYYDNLDRVRTHGDFEGWIAYYLKAIRDSARDAHGRAVRIIDYVVWCNSIMQNDQRFAKVRKTSLDILNFLFKNPIVSVSEVSRGIGKSYNATSNLIIKFVEAKILIERFERTPHRPYHFAEYLNLLEEELPSEDEQEGWIEPM